MNPDVRVLRFNPVQYYGNLRAFFDVYIDGVTIRDCRFIREAGKRGYVFGPQKLTEGGCR